MKKTIRGMTLAALMLSASQMTFADDSTVEYDGDGFVTPVAYVGDQLSSQENAYFAETAAEAARATRSTARNTAVQQAAQETLSPVQPVRQASMQPLAAAPAASAVQQVGGSCSAMGGGCDSAGCSSMGSGYMPSAGCASMPMMGGCSAMGSCGSPSCGCESGGGGCASFGGGLAMGGCGSPSCGCESGGGCASMGGLGLLGGGKRSGGLASALGLCNHEGWSRHEALLWFVQDRDAPSLIATAGTGVLPRLSAADTVFGDTLNGGLSGGYRGDMGLFLTDNIGVGGRFWWIGENEDSLSLSGDGSNQSIGRPFFNLVTGDEDALIVAFDNLFAGEVTATSQLDLLAAEAYGRVNLSSSSKCQLDLIGGYTYFSVDDFLGISSTSINANTGRTRTFNDVFDAENRFHGGQIGFEAIVTSGRWFARSLTKVHLGNMNQSLAISGSSTDVTAPAPGTAAASGLLAMGNQGTFERDEFTFVPEMNFKLGYRFRDHVEMTVGYTFVMFNDVALAGDNVDRVVDASFLNSPGPFGTRPAFDFQDSSLWVQGLDLGLAITF